MGTAGARSIKLSDFDALADALVSGVTVASPLRRGPFSLEAVGIDFGDVALRAGRNTPVLVQGALPDDTAWIVLPLRHRGEFLLNGRPSTPNAVAVYGAGAMHEGATHGDASWALMALRMTVVDRVLELPAGSLISRPGAHGMLVCDPVAWRNAVSLLQAAADVATTDPEVFEVEEARRSLRASVLEIAQDLLSGPWGGVQPRLLRPSPGRQRVVRAVEDYLQAEPGRVATTVDIAASLGVSASRLRSAIRSTFGISPPHYFRLRRLTMLRRALRSAGPDGISPKDVALAHGFWQLDRLRREYQETFAENLDDVVWRSDVAPGCGVRRAAWPGQ